MALDSTQKRGEGIIKRTLRCAPKPDAPERSADLAQTCRVPHGPIRAEIRYFLRPDSDAVLGQRLPVEQFSL